jgi:Glycosyltransferase 61
MILCPRDYQPRFWRGKFDVCGCSNAYFTTVDVPNACQSWCQGNEDEIVHYLSSIGFERIYPGRLSVEEQIRLFSEVEYVVGPHGAGMTNLTFCQEDCKVIELFDDRYKVKIYRTISKAIGLSYMSLGGGKHVFRRRLLDLSG